MRTCKFNLVEGAPLISGGVRMIISVVVKCFSSIVIIKFKPWPTFISCIVKCVDTV